MKTTTTNQETTMDSTFEMSGKAYRTDAETLKVLRGIVAAYRVAGSQDASAVSAMMHLGIMTGSIVEFGV